MSLIAAAGLPTSHGRFDTADPAALDWRIIRRILGRTQPYARMRNTIFVLTVVRAVQKPALAWALAAVINGPTL